MNPLAAQELGRSLTRLRKAHTSDASPKAIERWLLRHHDLEASDESIRKAHASQSDPMQMSLDLLVGLAAFYEVPPSELGKAAERRIKRMLAMADHGEPPNPHSGGGSGNRGRDLAGRESVCTATVVPLRQRERQSA